VPHSLRLQGILIGGWWAIAAMRSSRSGVCLQRPSPTPTRLLCCAVTGGLVIVFSKQQSYLLGECCCWGASCVCVPRLRVAGWPRRRAHAP
jgi:hypothetical protein